MISRIIIALELSVSKWAFRAVTHSKTFPLPSAAVPFLYFAVLCGVRKTYGDDKRTQDNLII